MVGLDVFWVVGLYVQIFFEMEKLGVVAFGIFGDSL